MEIRINFEKSQGYFVLLLVLLGAGVLLVQAYGGNNPSVVGHSDGEVEGVRATWVVRPIFVFWGQPDAASGWTEEGIIEAGVTMVNGTHVLPADTKEVLVYGLIRGFGSDFVGGTPDIIIYPTEASALTGYGFLVESVPSDIVPTDNIFISETSWFPLDSNGQLSYRIRPWGGFGGVTVQAYR